MRICIVSDTHGQKDELLAAVQKSSPLDGILHAGDETADVQWLRTHVATPVLAVSGNWDRPTDEFPPELVIDQFGPRILLVHGHTFRVKEGYEGLLSRAREQNSNIAVYGHTHVAYLGTHHGLMVINPGSLAQPRRRREKTFALMEIERTGGNENFAINTSLLTLRGAAVSQLRVELKGLP